MTTYESEILSAMYQTLDYMNANSNDTGAAEVAKAIRAIENKATDSNDELATVQESGHAGFHGVKEEDMAEAVKRAGFANWQDFKLN